MFKKISQNFVKSPLKFCLISQILVHSFWHNVKGSTLLGKNFLPLGVNSPVNSFLIEYLPFSEGKQNSFDTYLP